MSYLWSMVKPSAFRYLRFAANAPLKSFVKKLGLKPVDNSKSKSLYWTFIRFKPRGDHIKHEKLLKKAREHMFCIGPEDGAAHLARANMQYGLAKINYTLKKNGLEPNATFVSTPDETITRNIIRWNDGISYGGKISWGSGKEKFVILNVKPNACGMIVGGMQKAPKPKQLLSRLHKLHKKQHFIKDIKLEWDFNAGNHFIDIFKVSNPKIKMPPYVVLLHGGCGELKGDSAKGFGYYYDESKRLQEMMETTKTPFGPVHFLTGRNAKKYMKFHDFGVDFSLKRREVALKSVFPEAKPLWNIPHQYLLNYNEICLGCQYVHKKNQIFPVSVRADAPSYLVKGKKNYTAEVLDKLNFTKRAQKLGVLKRLRNANLVPHGSGYALPDVMNVEKIHHVNATRFYELNMINTPGRKVIRDIRSVPYGFRNNEVIYKVHELGLGEMAAELDLLYVLKA